MKIKSKIILFVCAFALIFSVLSVSCFAYVFEFDVGGTYQFVDYPGLVTQSGDYIFLDVSGDITLSIDGIEYTSLILENGYLSISSELTSYVYSDLDALWTYIDSNGFSETVSAPIFTLDYLSSNVDHRFVTWFLGAIRSYDVNSFYDNLYISISDGVFGPGAQLTPEQVMTLTLISTVLSYAFILLPLLLVIGFVLRCFRL